MSLVVSVPEEAKSLTDHPRYKDNMDDMFNIYWDILSGKTCHNPPLRGALGEASIRLKHGYWSRRHRDF